MNKGPKIIQNNQYLLVMSMLMLLNTSEFDTRHKVWQCHCGHSIFKFLLTSVSFIVQFCFLFLFVKEYLMLGYRKNNRITVKRSWKFNMHINMYVNVGSGKKRQQQTRKISNNLKCTPERFIKCYMNGWFNCIRFSLVFEYNIRATMAYSPSHV